jgi:hypothetical protein
MHVCTEYEYGYIAGISAYEEKGNNSWLCHGTPHCYVRRDFTDTYDGIITGTHYTTDVGR